MDSLAALALATEPPKPELLNREPHSRDDYIISRTMVKHVGIMGVYQSIIIFGLCFAGEYLIPESDSYLNKDGMVYPGRLYDWNGDDLYKNFVDDKGPSRHFTVVFNVFVLLQIFNMINARKIHDEINIFESLFENSMFVGIWLLIFVLQVLIVQFTQDVMKCSREVRFAEFKCLGSHRNAMADFFWSRFDCYTYRFPH
jgi:Ca2+ transporting ATPase